MIRRATRMGLEGDLTAMRLVLERTCGRAADAPVDTEPLGITIPRLHTAEDCNSAIATLIDGICKGTVERDVAKLLIDAIQTRVKSIELNELEERLTQLEQTAEHTTGRGA